MSAPLRPFRVERLRTRVLDNTQKQTADAFKALNSGPLSNEGLLTQTHEFAFPVSLAGASTGLSASPIVRAPQACELTEAHLVLSTAFAQSTSNYRNFTLIRYRDGVQRGGMAEGSTQYSGITAWEPWALEVTDGALEAGDVVALAIDANGTAAALPAMTLSFVWRLL